MYLRLKWLIQDHVAWVVLDVLPAGIAVTGAEGASREEPASRQHARCPAATPHCQTPSLLVTAPSPQVPRPAEASLASPPSCQPKKGGMLLPSQRVRDNSCQQPVVVSAVPDVVDLARGDGSPLLVLPQCVQLCGSRSETDGSASGAARDIVQRIRQGE